LGNRFVFVPTPYETATNLKQFALTEAGYVLVRLAQRFEEIVGVGNSWESKQNGGQGYFRTKLSLTASPADGVKVRMREARI
jgi:hypothetical protein